MKILAYAPYAGLAELITRAGESHGVFTDVVVENMEGAKRHLKNVNCDAYDVIISRGGTARILSETAPVPVVEIEVSHSDMLRMIQMAQRYKNRFAVVGFENITKMTMILCEILQYNINIPVYEIAGEKQAMEVMTELERRNIDFVVGDVISSQSANRCGIKSLLITSSYESVYKAVKDAVGLVKNIKKAVDSNALYAKLLCESPVAAYAEGRRFGNIPAKLEAYLNEQTRTLLTERRFNKRKRVNNQVYVVDGRLIESEPEGVTPAFFIRPINAPENSSAVKQVFNDSRQSASLLPSSKYIGPILARAREIPPDVSVLITGEIGAGKEAFAKYICKKGRSVFEIDFSQVSKRDWETLIDDPNTPLAENGYEIIFKNIEAADLKLSEKIGAYITETRLNKRCRIISIANGDLEEKIKKREFSRELYNCVNGARFYMPNLKERKEDIIAIAHFLINEYNQLYGKQVIGFADDAGEALENSDWPLNVASLKMIIQSLVIETNNYYIEAREVTEALRKTGGAPPEKKSSEKKKLCEIEMDAIRTALEEENNNCARAARRLGISRSTLWRKLGKTALEKTSGS